MNMYETQMKPNITEQANCRRQVDPIADRNCMTIIETPMEPHNQSRAMLSRMIVWNLCKSRAMFSRIFVWNLCKSMKTQWNPTDMNGY